MKHWHLIPGEGVSLRRREHPEIRIRILFRARDTRSAWFELGDRRLTFDLSNEGHLLDAKRHVWLIEGADRDGNTVSRISLGEHKHFTAVGSRGA